MAEQDRVVFEDAITLLHAVADSWQLRTQGWSDVERLVDAIADGARIGDHEAVRVAMFEVEDYAPLLGVGLGSRDSASGDDDVRPVPAPLRERINVTVHVLDEAVTGRQSEPRSDGEGSHAD
ncbi:CATRA system-associated protein [Streptomyces sp. WMMC940]|uniref:CATRA system-associated protein n=1 Tax=Streptomyces sp. WMMC940 TaxID=3015153 RepID=UPI0022B74F22|nr:CATRA system-associated protein [Streptomyces sp. WMMC940]MCZ7456248.1 hypothetical protein [Streptomyces sp. WMMC940]